MTNKYPETTALDHSQALKDLASEIPPQNRSAESEAALQEWLSEGRKLRQEARDSRGEVSVDQEGVVLSTQEKQAAKLGSEAVEAHIGGRV